VVRLTVPPRAHACHERFHGMGLRPQCKSRSSEFGVAAFGQHAVADHFFDAEPELTGRHKVLESLNTT
jgi:hypothetical protein